MNILFKYLLLSVIMSLLSGCGRDSVKDAVDAFSRIAKDGVDAIYGEEPDSVRNKVFFFLEDAMLEPRKVYRLSLTNRGWERLPESVGIFENLEELDLSDNKLTNIPDIIDKFPKLKRLIINNNKLDGLPENISLLANLEMLSVYSNKLSSLPESIGKLQNLSELNLGSNKLIELPESLCKLKNLVNLSLEYNKFTSLPECIFKLSKLQKLNLAGLMWDLPQKEKENIQKRLPGVTLNW